MGLRELAANDSKRLNEMDWGAGFEVTLTGPTGDIQTVIPKMVLYDRLEVSEDGVPILVPLPTVVVDTTAFSGDIPKSGEKWLMSFPTTPGGPVEDFFLTGDHAVEDGGSLREITLKPQRAVQS